MKESILNEGNKNLDYSLMALLAILLIFLIVFSIQWYDAWIELQTIQTQITATGNSN